jgi:hypothetical protein
LEITTDQKGSYFTDLLASSYLPLGNDQSPLRTADVHTVHAHISLNRRCQLEDTGTNFGAGLVKADPLPAYDETPVGELRRAWAAGSFRVTGDASKVVDAMIAVADDHLPPIRLTLGSIAYESIRSALGERASMLEAGKEVTLSADRT